MAGAQGVQGKKVDKNNDGLDDALDLNMNSIEDTKEGITDDSRPKTSGGTSGKTKNGSLTDTTSSRTNTVTPRETTNSDLDLLVSKLFGKRATPEQKKKFYAYVHAKELAYATTGGSTQVNTTTNKGTTSKTSSTSNNYSFSYENALNDFAVNLAKDILSSGKTFGGQAKVAYDELRQYAYDMGLTVTNATLIKNTISSVRGTKDIESVTAEMREHAIELYDNYADKLKANPKLTLRTAIAPQLETISTVLDIPDSAELDLDDSLVQKILTVKDDKGQPRKLNKNDLVNLARDDNRFQYSTMAKNEAIDLGQGLARAMGFGVE